MRSKFLISIWIVSLIFLVRDSNGETIDFEQFEVGDGIEQINAFYAPMGFQFDSDGDAGSIQIVGGSKVFAAFTPNPNQFDVLLNFDFKVDNVSADFLDNGGTSDTFSVLEGYDRPKTPTGNVEGFLFSVFGNANLTLSYNWPGPGLSEIRCLHFSQDLATNSFVTIDNIHFVPVFELGDVNRDGAVNLLDVDPFIMVLSSGEFQTEADCNNDGVVNLLDVDPFIAILGGG